MPSHETSAHATSARALFRVVGRVQGVAFRAHTRTQALALGLRGHAINLADGSVEVLAIGDTDAIAQLERWLHVGPPLARVDAVERRSTDASPHDDASSGFRVG